MKRHGNMKSFCKRGHDLDGGARGCWPSGKTYCIPCMAERKERQKASFAFDILERKGDDQLCERIREQARAIKALQEEGDSLRQEIEALKERLAQARRRKVAVVPKPYEPRPFSSAKRHRPGIHPSIGALLARIS